jgi:8-oxo-dGTP diphosphatase
MNMGHSQAELICAAGGLVWRDTPRGREIMAIHRPRYDDWSLPKGKLKKGERWDSAALREVEEETGYQAHLERFAGITFYYANNRPKVVLFWNMSLPENPVQNKPPSDSPDEGDLVEWLLPAEALQRLSYEGERRVVTQES